MMDLFIRDRHDDGRAGTWRGDVSKMIDSALMDFALKTRDFVSKTRIF